MTGTYILGIIALFFAAFIFIGIRNNINEKKLFMKKCADEYGAAPSSRLKKQRDDISGFYNANKGDFFIDDITWNDLSLDEIFERISYSETSSGEEYLYYMLRCHKTSDDGEFSKLEKRLLFLSQNEEERIRIKRSLHSIGKSGKYSIYDYLPVIDANSAGSNVMHFVMLIIMCVSIVLMCTASFAAGFILLMITFAVNMITYFRISARLSPYLATFAYVLRLMRGGDVLSGINSPVFDDCINEIKECNRKLSGFSRGSWLLSKGYGGTGSGNPFEIILDYVRMLTHIDLIKFNMMYKKLKDEIPSVERLTALIGYIDSVMSICYYRASLKDYCVPELKKSAETYRIEDGTHPLMEGAVANSFDAKTGYLISGSNASGKSTFLKMCAINSILAQSIHTCTAKAYEASYFRIYTSMALRDDLNLGDSYYMVEIKSLKRILDAASAADVPVLCFIDEVLRGTNTIERIAASSKILAHFAGEKSRVLCFAATHDGELSELLSKLYEVHHFEGDVNNGDVLFDYRLKEGPATKRNAISLLQSIGYDENIVKEAEGMAKKFEETGVWSL